MRHVERLWGMKSMSLRAGYCCVSENRFEWYTAPSSLSLVRRLIPMFVPAYIHNFRFTVITVRAPIGRFPLTLHCAVGRICRRRSCSSLRQTLALCQRC